MGTGELNAGSNPAMDKHPIWGGEILLVAFFFFIETHLFRVHVTYLKKDTYNTDTCLQYIAYYLQRKH